MPLVTENLAEARAVVSTLELRAQSAEQLNVSLLSTIDTLKAGVPDLLQQNNLLTQFTVSQAQSNSQLLAQQAGQVSPDLALDDFIASLGLAVALGEASMPDRAVSSITVQLQAYVTLDQQPDGSRKVGLRLYQPELGQPTALATTSFGVAKIPPQPGVAAPRSLYTVVQDKQSVYASPFWTQFKTGSPPVQPAAQIVTEIAKIFANIGSWSFPFLVAEATNIAGLESTLSNLVATVGSAQAVAAYSGAVLDLLNLTKALDPSVRSRFVAGDVFALAAALDATTRATEALQS